MAWPRCEGAGGAAARLVLEAWVSQVRQKQHLSSRRRARCVDHGRALARQIYAFRMSDPGQSLDARENRLPALAPWIRTLVGGMDEDQARRFESEAELRSLRSCFAWRVRSASGCNARSRRFSPRPSIVERVTSPPYDVIIPRTELHAMLSAEPIALPHHPGDEPAKASIAFVKRLRSSPMRALLLRLRAAYTANGCA